MHYTTDWKQDNHGSRTQNMLQKMLRRIPSHEHCSIMIHSHSYVTACITVSLSRRPHAWWRLLSSAISLLVIWPLMRWYDFLNWPGLMLLSCKLTWDSNTCCAISYCKKQCRKLPHTPVPFLHKTSLLHLFSIHTLSSYKYINNFCTSMPAWAQV